MGDTSPNGRWTLRQLPFVPRLVITVYLLSVGIGYFSALVQLHFQHASAGQLLPGPEEVLHAYGSHDHSGLLEQLIIADETKPFNATGQMRAAFFTRAAGWKKDVKNVAKEKKLDEAAATKALRLERSAEPDAIVAWLKDGAKEAAYSADADAKAYPFVLPAEIAAKLHDESSSDFFKKDDKGAWTANIKEIVEVRCVRCHAPGKRDAAGRIHLHDWEHVMHYVTPETHDSGSGHGTGMALQKLAQTTHVHLLGFAMLYGLTGFIFSCTSYPGVVRFVLAPMTMIFQVAEISCWWLVRSDPVFVVGIMGLGGVVALTLGVQIILTLFDLFDLKGKAVVAGLLVAGALVAGTLHQQVIEPRLQHEKTAAGKL